MAKLLPGIKFTGSIGGLTAYKRQGVEEVILRQKRGPNSKSVKNSPAYERTRENNAEFSARAKLSQAIARLLKPLKPVFDHNIHAELNKRLLEIQKKDGEALRGQRSIYPAKFPQFLEGMNFNRKSNWEAVIGSPVGFNMDLENDKATISINSLIPGISFFNPTHFPFYQLAVIMGPLPDMQWQDGEHKMSLPLDQACPECWHTEWMPADKPFDGADISLALQHKVEGEHGLMAAVAVFFGRSSEAVQYWGAGKILGVVGDL